MARFNWDAELREFRNYLSIRRNSSETIKLRMYHLGRYRMHLKNRSPLPVSPQRIANWFAQQRWGARTMRSYRSSLAVFYTWRTAFHGLARNPMVLLPPASELAAIPSPVADKTYFKALYIADTRTQLMIRFAAQAGMRRGEVARIHRSDLIEDLIGYSLRVKGKGNKMRIVPLIDDLALAIKTSPAEWLFPNGLGSHLTPGHVGKLVSTCLPLGISMHDLRHRFATKAHWAGADIYTIQQLLGHAKPETTQIYVLPRPEYLRKAVETAAADSQPQSLVIPLRSA